MFFFSIEKTNVQIIFNIPEFSSFSNSDKTNDGLFGYPPWNQHIPYQGTFEDGFPFPQVGYVSSLEGINFLKIKHQNPKDDPFHVDT